MGKISIPYQSKGKDAEMAEIKAHEQNLSTVFSDTYLFEIPTYQRPYSWEKDQVEELLDDLLNAMDRDSNSPYFLGNIVLIKDGMLSKSEVIDGQQRLATLTMLFCVLRELSIDPKAKISLDGFVKEAGDIFRKTQDQYRVSLRTRDQEFFRLNVQETGGIARFLESTPTGFSDSQQRIFENTRHLHSEISKYDEGVRQNLAGFIAQQCYLVIVTTSDKSSAYRIFSVLNDRGLSLSPTDILKAEIVGKMQTPEEEHQYADKWESIELELGRDHFQSLFGYIRMIHLKAKQRRTLQEEFQENILGEITNAKAKEFIDAELEPYANVYGTVSRESYSGSGDAGVINTYLKYLNRLDNADWIPPAMAFFQHNQNRDGQLVRFVKDLERLAYGMFILRANINERINRYAGVLDDIEHGRELWRHDSPLQLTTTEKSHILDRLNGDVYLQTRVHHLPVLLRLDSLLADDGASYNHSVVTVEHVLPQNPARNSQWLSWFPDEPERAQWTHRLANLVLLSRRRNASASNREFNDKKATYFLQGGVSPFAITTQVVSKAEWTPDVLEQRQQELLGILKKEWRLD